MREPEITWCNEQELKCLKSVNIPISYWIYENKTAEEQAIEAINICKYSSYSLLQFEWPVSQYGAENIIWNQ